MLDHQALLMDIRLWEPTDPQHTPVLGERVHIRAYSLGGGRLTKGLCFTGLGHTATPTVWEVVAIEPAREVCLPGGTGSFGPTYTVRDVASDSGYTLDVAAPRIVAIRP
jgi:hypothetical protein